MGAPSEWTPSEALGNALGHGGEGAGGFSWRPLAVNPVTPCRSRAFWWPLPLSPSGRPPPPLAFPPSRPVRPHLVESWPVADASSRGGHHVAEVRVPRVGTHESALVENKKTNTHEGPQQRWPPQTCPRQEGAARPGPAGRPCRRGLEKGGPSAYF